MNTTTKKLLRQTNLIMGGIITFFVIFLAVFASFIAPYHPVDDADLMVSEEPPSATFWFGTDNQGRPVKAGTYTVNIEAAREHGTYQIIKQTMDFPGVARQIDVEFSFQGSGLLIETIGRDSLFTLRSKIKQLSGLSLDGR